MAKIKYLIGNLKEFSEEIQKEILGLYKKYLKEKPKGHTFFVIIKNDVLQGVSSLKGRCGYYYLRGCVVKPEFRGNGLQKKLIKKRINYLRLKNINEVRVTIYAWNIHSITNVLSKGFKFEKIRLLPNGKTGNTYLKKF